MVCLVVSTFVIATLMFVCLCFCIVGLFSVAGQEWTSKMHGHVIGFTSTTAAGSCIYRLVCWS